MLPEENFAHLKSLSAPRWTKNEMSSAGDETEVPTPLHLSLPLFCLFLLFATCLFFYFPPLSLVFVFPPLLHSKSPTCLFFPPPLLPFVFYLSQTLGFSFLNFHCCCNSRPPHSSRPTSTQKTTQHSRHPHQSRCPHFAPSRSSTQWTTQHILLT